MTNPQTQEMGRAEAVRLEEVIIRSIDELESNLLKFIQGKAWIPLGYKSFVEWFDLKVKSVRVGPAIRAVVVYELQAPDPITGRRLTDQETADRLGTSKATIQRDTGRKKEKINSGANAPELITKTGEPALPLPAPAPRSPEKVVPLEEVVDAVEVVEVVEDAEIVDDHETPPGFYDAPTVTEVSEPTETPERLFEQVEQARKIILGVLSDSEVTEEIAKFILDDFIADIEDVAKNTEARLQTW